MSDTPTRPFGYISGVLDVSTGLLYVSSEAAMQQGCYPINLVVVGGPMAALKKLVHALREVEDAAQH